MPKCCRAVAWDRTVAEMMEGKGSEGELGLNFATAKVAWRRLGSVSVQEVIRRTMRG